MREGRYVSICIGILIFIVLGVAVYLYIEYVRRLEIVKVGLVYRVDIG